VTQSIRRALLAATASAALCAAGGSAFASIPSTASLARNHPAMRQVLHYGSRGHWVMTLQADLKLLGYPQAGPIDGIFGPKTEAGLKAFQIKHGFPATGVTSEAVWQDILAGFGLVPPYDGASQGTGGTGSSSGNQGGSNTSGGGAGSSSGGSIGTGTYSANVLPASFPTGGAPVAEPSLPNASAGVKGQFTPSVSTIDGRPVLKAFHMVATAYAPTLADNYPYGAVDAFGQPLQDGMVAVDPSVIPLGTVVYVTGYHDNFLPNGGFLGKAMDTGGAIKGYRIDIFINQSQGAVNDFGVQEVTVYELGN
jgi:3D (Asp-Asp-Asp) domain-containing protein